MKQPGTSSPKVVAGISLSLAMGAMAAGLTYAVRGNSSQFFGPSVYRGSRSRRSIALTFDDGPSERSGQLIEMLGRWNVPATFFQCGLNVQRHGAIARAIHAAGHEIGNHTFSHARLCPRFSRSPNFLSAREIAREFHWAQEIIRLEVGVSATLLRAPYGLRWFGMRAMQEELGLLGVMWTVIGRDWEWPADRIADLVLRKAAPGGIICLHDGRDIQREPDISETLRAVKEIVPRLLAEGYRFETVSQILRD